MKILITGSTGFIGCCLLRRLVQTDHELRCLVRHSSDTTLCEDLELEMVYGDVCDKPSLVRALQGCDWLIDLANVYDFWVPDYSIFDRVNVHGTRNLMEAALETNIAKIVHVSTALIYGKPEDVPYTEESEFGPEAFSEYARTKRAGEQIIWKMAEEQGLPVVVIYPVGVIGKGDTKAPARAVENIVHGKQAAGAFNDVLVTLVHVRDVVEAVVRALEKEGNIGERYLLGKEQITFGEYYDVVAEFAQVKPPAMEMPGWMTMASAHMLTALSKVTKRPPWLGMSVDQMRTFKEGFICDGSKAERELGIQYTPIREGLAEEVEQALMTPA